MHVAPVIAPMLALGRQHPRRERTMWRARLAVAALAIIATSAALESARAEDELKIAVGGRGIGETFVTEVGYKAGLFHRHNLALDIFYTGGGQVFWYVPADSPIRGPQDLAGKTVAYSNNGSSTHAGVLALQKHYNIK